MAEAPELLQRLHAVALRAASRKAGKTFEGCSVASRWLKSQGCVDKKILKGLFRLKEKRLSDDGYEIHEIEEEGRAYSYIERHWLGEI